MPERRLEWLCIKGVRVWATLISSEYKLQTCCANGSKVGMGFSEMCSLTPVAELRIYFSPGQTPRSTRPGYSCWHANGVQCALSWAFAFLFLSGGRSPALCRLPLCPVLTRRLTAPGGLSAILSLERDSAFSFSTPLVGFHSMYLVCYQTRDEYSVLCPISCPKCSANYLRQVYLDIYIYIL